MRTLRLSDLALFVIDYNIIINNNVIVVVMVTVTAAGWSMTSVLSSFNLALPSELH